MANRYLKTAGGAFTAAATWSATGAVGVDSVGPPTAADNCILELASGNLTINSGAVCRGLDTTSGTGSYAGTITHTAAVTLNIGDATAAAGNVAFKLNSGMTYTLGSNSTSILNFVSTSATVQTIDFGGKTTSSVTYNGVGGSWQMVSSQTTGSAGSIITLTSGTLNTNGQTCSWGFFSSNNSNTRTLTLGASAITITGTGGTTTWNTSTTTNLTLNANTSTITLSGATVSFAGGAGLTYNNLILSGSGSATISNGSGTYANFTRTGTAVKTSSLILAGSYTVTGALTLTGNSVTNRLLVESNTIGTSRTFTAAAVSITNVDFTDTTGAGAASPFTGTSLGNCLGNSNITFDTPVTQTATGTASFTWSTHGWTTRVPLPQDNVVINNAFAAGRTITVDMPRIGANIDTSGCTGSPNFTWASAIDSFGNITMASGVNPSGGIVLWTLSGRGSHTITNNGVTWGVTTRMTISSFGGSYTLQDALTATPGAGAAYNIFSVAVGTFNTNNYNITYDTLIVNSGATCNLGTSTFTLNAIVTVNIVNISSSATFNGASATFVVGSHSTTRTFIGGGKTFGTLTYTVAGSTGGLDITGSNTFNTINFSDTTNARSLLFTAATTTTVTNWNVNGTPGLLMTIDTVTAATHTLTKPSGTVSSDYLSIKNSIATGGAGWYAGGNSTNVSGNTGWLFTRPVYPARTITNFRLTV